MSESTTSRRGATGRALGWCVVVSIVLHVVFGLVATALPWFEGADPQTEASEQEDESMSVRLATTQSPSPEKEKTSEKKTSDKRQKRQKNEPSKQQRPTPEPTESLNRKTVDQSNNEQVPEEADYLASEANQTDEQTQARETTTSRKQAGKRQSPSTDTEKSKAKGGQNPTAVASRQLDSPSQTRERREAEPPPAPKPKQQPSDREERKEEPQQERSPIDEPSAESGDVRVSDGERKSERQEAADEASDPPPMPTMSDYEKLFGGKRSRNPPEDEPQGQGGPGHAMFKTIEERRGQVKGALENYLTHIKPGNHTSVNARRSVYASYINRIHRKIHARWGNEYLPMLDSRYGPGHELSDPSLHALLEIVVDAKGGEVEDVNIVQSSGVTSYDAEAVMIAYNTGPHPNPPEEVVSPDGNVYFHWNFWRNQRQCGTFGVSIFKKLEGEETKREVSPTAGGGAK